MPTSKMRLHRSRLAAACLLAACALGAASGCRSSKKPLGGAPLPEKEQEALAAFIKVAKCEATTCDKVKCTTYSDGQTDKLPSHVAKCRWTDTRASSNGGSHQRCAFTHYSYDQGRAAFGNMFASEPVAAEDCAPDKAFVQLIKNELGYSGEL
jgi:hypothetical protein